MKTDLKHKLLRVAMPGRHGQQPAGAESTSRQSRGLFVRVLSVVGQLCWGGVLRLLTATFSVLILTAAFLAWNIKDGQVALDALTPYLMDTLNEAADPYGIVLDHTTLRWGGWRNRFELTVSGLSVQNKDGQPLAEFENAALEFSIQALFSGYVAPTRVILIGSELSVTRTPDGSFTFDVPGAGTRSIALTLSGQAQDQGERNGGAPATSAGPDFVDFLADVFQPLDAPQAGEVVEADTLLTAQFFQGISIRDAVIMYEDQETGLALTGERLGLEVTRSRQSITVGFTVESDFGASDLALEGALEHSFSMNQQQVYLDFEDLWLPDLAAFAPELELARGFDLTVQGTVGFVRLASGDIDDITFDVETGAGAFQIPNVLDAPIAVASAQTSGVVDQGFGRIRFEEALLETAGPIMRFSGDLTRRMMASGTFDPGAPDLNAVLEIADLDVADLGRYWPAPVAAKARAWVLQHFRGGRVPQARFVMDFDGSTFGVPKSKPGPFDIKLAVENAEVAYLGDLQPLTQASGLVEITPDLLDVKVPSGQLGALQVTDLTVTMEDILDPGPMTTVKFVASGEIGEVLRILDQQPLGVVSRLGLQTTDVSGQGASRVVLSFPATDSVSVQDLKVAAASNLTGVTWLQFRPDIDVTDGAFQLKIDGGTLTLDGAAQVNQLPVDLVWVSDLAAQSEVAEQFLLRTSFNTRDIAADQSVALNILDGDVVVEADIKQMRSGVMVASATADLAQARLMVPETPIVKPVGEPGQVQAQMTVQPDAGDVDVSAFVLQTDQLFANGNFQMNLDAGLRRMQLERFAWGRTDVSVVAGMESSGDYIVALSGQALDLAPFMDSMMAQADDPAAGQADRTQSPAGHPVDGVNISVRATLQRLFFNETTAFESVKGAVRLNGASVLSGGIEATAGAQNAPVRLSVAPNAYGRRFVMESQDAGSVLTSLFPQDRMVGGEVLLTAQVYDQDPGKPVTGTLMVEDFRIAEAPVFTRILQLGSLTGIADLFQGEGVQFTGLNAPFQLINNLVTLDDAKAYGPAVGFTLSGTVHRDSDVIAMKGTVIPAYSINSFFGRIPILGDLLSGEDGEVVGIAYAISGTTEQPKLTVNPLSALTPGFLRRLFPFLGDIGTTPEAPPANGTPEGSTGAADGG